MLSCSSTSDDFTLSNLCGSSARNQHNGQPKRSYQGQIIIQKLPSHLGQSNPKQYTHVTRPSNHAICLRITWTSAHELKNAHSNYCILISANGLDCGRIGKRRGIMSRNNGYVGWERGSSVSRTNHHLLTVLSSSASAPPWLGLLWTPSLATATGRILTIKA